MAFQGPSTASWNLGNIFRNPIGTLIGSIESPGGLLGGRKSTTPIYGPSAPLNYGDSPQNSQDIQTGQYAPTPTPKQTSTYRTPTSGTSAGSSSPLAPTEPTYQPRMMSLLGKQYDVNTPEGFRGFQEAKLAYLDDQNRQGIGGLNDSFRRATGYGERRDGLRLDDVMEDSDLGRQKKGFLQQILDNLEGIDRSQKENTQNINTYYSGMGDITQSSQGFRQNELDTETGKARGRVNEQKQEGISSLERALADYLNQDQQARRGIASDYQTKRDSLTNETESSIQDIGDNLEQLKVAMQNAVYQGKDPSMIRQEIARNQNIFDQLVKARQGSNIFKQFGSVNGDVNTPEILNYLNPQGV